MKNYLSPKELYFIKKIGLHKISIIQFKDFFKKKLHLFNIEADSNLIEFLIINNTKLGLILKFIRSGFIGNFKLNEYCRNQILLEILSYRIKKNDKLSLCNNFSLKFNNPNGNIFSIIGPVCPDYSYIYTNENRYRYTFETVGSGIGLVAQKAINNIYLLKKLSKDLSNRGLILDFKILLGDFEASEQNLKALNETKSKFLDKVRLSCEAIQEETNISTDLFSTLCQGLDGWQYTITHLKNIYDIHSFNDLQHFLPNLNHEKKLISRLPLYQKWFGSNRDYKQIFFEQTVEYMAMGDLIFKNYLNDSVLLASDHKAMRDYYSAINNIGIIASYADY